MVMQKRIETLFGGRSWLFLVVLLFGVGLFLRLYHISETATFLGDQGRDALIMHDIVTFRHFPALGPITSVGSIFLGPLYYYLMAPWLALFLFNPVGPAVGVALTTSVALPLQFLAVKEMTNKTTALLSVFFATFSWVLVEYSRFSWNPNLLPQVTLFSVYTLYKIVETRKLRYFIAHGVLLSLAVQLHYLAIFLLPISVVVLLLNDITDLSAGGKGKRDPLLLHIGNTTILGLSFIIPFAPFVLFEFLHSFPNVRSVLHFSSTNSGASTTPFITEITTTLQNIVLYAFQRTITEQFALVLLLALIITWSVLLWRRHKLSYSVGTLIVLILGVSLYKGPKYAHYLGGVYLLIYVLLGAVLVALQNKTRIIGSLFIGAAMVLFLSVNIPKYYYFYEREHQNQIDKARQIARTIISMNPDSSFTLTASPDAYADYPYRYFLRSMNHEAISKEADAYATPMHLFVVCETECNPMNDPQWAVAHFNAKGISERRTVPTYPWITIYKLTR